MKRKTTADSGLIVHLSMTAAFCPSLFFWREPYGRSW